MEIFANLLDGFVTASTPVNLLYVTIGVIAGTLVGALPGIGPGAGLAMLIPLSFGMDPTTAIILMAGIYYGSMYGGTLTSVLMNVPGEAASVVTCLDGYAMARQGRAGPALTIAAIGSFVAGTFSVVMLMLLAPPIARMALSFGPPEYFALMALGMTAVGGLTGRSRLKGYAMALLGLALAMVGLDYVSGAPRFTFGRVELLDGIDFLPIAIGLFGIGEVLVTIERLESHQVIKPHLREMMITLRDFAQSTMPVIRGTVIGFAVGVLPGAGATVASFMSYFAERRLSRHPETFGKGAIAGVAGPESANNAATGGAMIPLLTLGIPGSGTTAVMLGALLMFGLQPGPFLFTKNPEFVWGLMASMYIGNAILVVLNIAFVPAFVWALRVPYRIIAPLILVFCMVGVYSLDFSTFDLWLMLGAGMIGYFMKKLDYSPAPLVLALVLGRPMEDALRQSLMMSLGDPSILFNRPISGSILAAVTLIVAWPLAEKFVRRWWRRAKPSVGT